MSGCGGDETGVGRGRGDDRCGGEVRSGGDEERGTGGERERRQEWVGEKREARVGKERGDRSGWGRREREDRSGWAGKLVGVPRVYGGEKNFEPL